MRIYDNGIYREATEEEIAKWQEVIRKSQLPTSDERIESQVTYTAMMTGTLIVEE